MAPPARPRWPAIKMVSVFFKRANTSWPGARSQEPRAGDSVIRGGHLLFVGRGVRFHYIAAVPANPRQSCVRALLEWEKGKYFSDEILHTSLEKNPLPPLDRAFFMETFFGVLRNLSRLDFLIAQLREGRIDPQTRAVLRLGLYQIFHMRTAPHAAVNESVALGRRARGASNALLRRALRESEELESTPAH